MLSNVTDSRFYPECNTERGFIDQLYIELGYGIWMFSRSITITYQDWKKWDSPITNPIIKIGVTNAFWQSRICLSSSWFVAWFLWYLASYMHSLLMEVFFDCFQKFYRIFTLICAEEWKYPLEAASMALLKCSANGMKGCQSWNNLFNLILRWNSLQIGISQFIVIFSVICKNHNAILDLIVIFTM